MGPRFLRPRKRAAHKPKYLASINAMRQFQEGCKIFPVLEGLPRYSKAKIRFQSFFMLMTVQPLVFASSYNDCGKVPILVSGNP